jgi:hypothetical protein
MRISAIVVPILLCLSGCAFFRSKPPPPPPRPLYAGRTATLEITNGIGVAGSVELPRGFEPNPATPPMWLAQGTVVGVAGTLDEKTVVLGFGGERLTDMTTLASDFGPGAPAGRILEVAASPDGMELATAVAATDTHRLDLMIIDSISGGKGHSVASFDGDDRVASLSWLDRTTIAIVVQTPTQTASNAVPNSAASGLYAVGISGIGSVAHFDRIPCRLGRMSFSPNRRFAVSEGDRDVASAIVDLHTQACAEIHTRAPIRILGWAPDSSALLYAASAGDGKNVGVFRFTVATAQRTLVAVSSAAAAYASDGTIVALGNGRLSWKGVAQDPGAKAKAEIALLNPLTAEVTINSLGFQTAPAMFARSTMVLTPASDSAAIDTFVPVADGLLRELIDYSYPSRSAFVLASGRANGPLAMSWSDNGSALAIVDGDASLARLTVLIPPH